MGRFTIDCKWSDKTYSKDYNTEEGIVIEYEEYRNTFEIFCDGKPDNNSFVLDYYGDNGIEITRNRCNIQVYIPKNNSKEYKNFNIFCTHADDASVSLEIVINQKGQEYTLEVTDTDTTYDEELNAYSITLSSIVNANESITKNEGNGMYFEEKEFKIKAIGGSEKFRVTNILKCHKSTFTNTYTIKDEEGNEKQIEDEIQTTQQTTFDDGFILMKNENGLLFKNYGRPFLDKDDYYTIEIQHNDDRETNVNLIVKYDEIVETNSRENSILSDFSTAQISSIEDEIINEERDIETTPSQITVEEENIAIMEKETVYKISIDEDVSNCTIQGKSKKIIPFSVTENGEESDLMIMATSSAVWCKIEVVQKYNDQNEIVRNLKLKINDKPLSVRNTKITLFIIDNPSTTTSFILTNKP